MLLTKGNYLGIENQVASYICVLHAVQSPPVCADEYVGIKRNHELSITV